MNKTIQRLRIAVLMGGKSPEHEVSLQSGREVVKHLNPQKYEVLPVVISRDGKKWQIADKQKLLHSPARVEQIANSKWQIANGKKLATRDGNFLAARGVGKVDLVFIVMHGPYGEDGAIQGMLETLGLPYTGSGILASALGMNKVVSRKLWREDGLTVPRFEVARSKTDFKKVLKEFSFPLVVKPVAQGSSVGVTVAHSEKEILPAFEKAIVFDGQVIVEEYIAGREITCAILGNENPTPLPLVEIIPKTEFFDYDAKYDPALCDEIVPARIFSQLTKKIQEIAIRAYKIISCSGFGRVDMILGKDGKIYILELNTIPGLTANSLLPKAAKEAGLEFPRLLDKIIEDAYQKSLSSSPSVAG